MNFEEVVSENTNSSNSQFWKAIGIWMRNPHVVNRRILASQDLLVAEVTCNVLHIFQHVEKLQIKPDDFECALSGDVKYLLDILNITECCQLVQCTDSVVAVGDDKTYLHVRKLLPRNTQIFSYTLEFVFVDKGSASVTIFHRPIVSGKQSLGPENTAYKIQHREYVSMCINICKTDDNYGRSYDWLKFKFFPRLMKWMSSEDDTGPRITSLSLISVEKYTLLYNRLKEKYGTRMVNTWPENTDPAKYVYEDVAIATYLLLLWEKERQEKGIQELQTFVDLGCGNGLLVYILSSEGHSGTGIDLRRRKIWDLFPESTRLQVCEKYAAIINYLSELRYHLNPYISIITFVMLLTIYYNFYYNSISHINSNFLFHLY